jgi:hypothetical protein
MSHGRVKGCVIGRRIAATEGVGRRIRRSVHRRVVDVRADLDLVKIGAKTRGHLGSCDPCVNVAERGAQKEDEHLLWTHREGERAATRRNEAAARQAEVQQRQAESTSSHWRRRW